MNSANKPHGARRKLGGARLRFLQALAGLAALWVTAGSLAQEPPDTNYDEPKVGVYELPDPLRCFDGQKVPTTSIWREKRRPELLSAFATNVYGRTPTLGFRLRADVTEGDTPAVGMSVGGSVGYHLRAGDHEITPEDWRRYLDFADRHLGRERTTRSAAAVPAP